MSNRDPDQSYENLPESLRFFWEAVAKTIRTTVPGIVVRYQPGPPPRVTVRPAMDLLLADGTTTPRPVLTDVPVVWPSGGGFTFTWPLEPGDAVLVAFCERDISGFKADRLARRLPSNRVMSEADAVVLPGFGPTEPVPATTVGVALQTDDGETAVIVEDGHITLKADRITLDYPGGPATWPP